MGKLSKLRKDIIRRPEWYQHVRGVRMHKDGKGGYIFSRWNWYSKAHGGFIKKVLRELEGFRG